MLSLRTEGSLLLLVWLLWPPRHAAGVAALLRCPSVSSPFDSLGMRFPLHPQGPPALALRRRCSVLIPNCLLALQSLSPGLVYHPATQKRGLVGCGLAEGIWAIDQPSTSCCSFSCNRFTFNVMPRKESGMELGRDRNPRGMSLDVVSWLGSTHLMCVELVTPAVRFILRILCALEKCGQTLCRGNSNAFR